MMIQNNFITKLASSNKRIDGRLFDQVRKIVVDDKIIEKAEGAALVKLGNTQVIAGVKLEVGEPFPDKPNDGVLMTSAEFSPISSPDFEQGPPRENSIELARIVDRGIRECGAIDTKKLCIEDGKKVWMVCIDINILDNFGNLIDASAMASAVALNQCVFPKYEDGKVIATEKTKKKLPVLYTAVACTFAKIGNHMLLDPNLEEEEASSCRLTLSTRDDGNLCAIQKGGTGHLSSADVEHALDVAVERGKEIRKLLK